MKILRCMLLVAPLLANPVAEARPTGFDQGSGVAVEKVTGAQLDALVLTAKVWGFLKYHHPAVTAGKHPWDDALLRKLPEILNSPGKANTQRLLVAWIDSLGPVAPCMACAKRDSQAPMKPRLGWIEDERMLGPQLRARLRSIHVNRVPNQQFFVKLGPGAGNGVFDNEPAYPDIKFPDAGFQVLAVLRFWNLVEYWFAYRDLIDENWDAVLRDSLERVVKAQDKAEYQRELAALVARADDGHANAYVGFVTPPAGGCQLPVHLRVVEGQFVVKSLWEGAPDELRAGDVITAVEGRAVGTIVEDVRRYYGASNEVARLRGIARSLTRGECGDVKVTVNRAAPLVVAAHRVPVDWAKLVPDSRNDRAGDTLQWLTPKIAYLKLSTIKAADVAKHVAAIARADALVVDIRNYPSEFVVFALGTRLVDEPTGFARFTIPDLGNPGQFSWGVTVKLEPAQPHFGGRVAILVDELSQSQAEYTTMALRASPRAIVVGSQTAGADGNMSLIVLPGDVRAGFSGIGVFYPDRSPTQQVGVKIDVPCKPTIAGIRAGRDEVLDCALRALSKE
jgi:C-terminal processing protease CtpA/Prc